MSSRWPYANGKAPSTYLLEVEPGNHLRPDAAAAWVLFRAACYAATGVWLTITSANRSYERQVEIFLERYTRSNTGRKSRVWNGVRYWLRVGAADAAVPGTSNHGWAIAVDMGGYTRAWTWIVNNCARFGFSLAEGLSVGEKWHIVFTRAWDGVLGGGGRVEEGSLSHPSPTIPASPGIDPAPAGPTQEELDDMAATKGAAIVRDYETESKGTVRTALIYPDGTARKLSAKDDITGAVEAHAKIYGVAKDKDNEDKPDSRVDYTQLTSKQWTAFWKVYPGRKVGFDSNGV